MRLILTAADVKGLGGLPCKGKVRQVDGTYPKFPPHPILVGDVVRHVGDPIAFIVADELEQAKAASEAIEVDYDPLPVIVEMKAALAKDAPLVWPEYGTNLAFETARGARQATDDAFAKAARVSKVEIVNNRLVANYMETRGVVAEYDPRTDRTTLTMGTQGGHGMRDRIAKDILNIPASKIRVITPDVGGGFGTKSFAYHEYPLAAIAAKQLGRPVKWIGERSDHFLSDSHGRDNLSTAEMAMDENGKFLAMRVEVLSNMGAYLSQYAPWIPGRRPDHGDRALRRAAPACALSRHLHAYGAGRRLSRRRAAGGGLSRRTARRPVRPRHRPRSDRDPQAQLHPDRQAAVRDAGRAHI